MNDPFVTDPFEQAFFDYLAGDTGAEITVHNNKGDDEIMQVAYFFRPYEHMPQLEKMALAACYGHVLDVGAGAGCHSLYLQNNGLDVTALDIRPGFVRVMQQRGLKKTIEGDIQSLEKGGYDTLLMLMNGIGFARDFEGLEQFFMGARKLMNPGGQIILDSSDLIFLYREEDGSIKLNLTENYYGEVEYQVEYKGLLGAPFKWLFVDYSNLSFYADRAGFTSELLFEDENMNYLARLY